jgi:hypothetical protein
MKFAQSPALRRYNIRVLILSVVYVAALFAVLSAFKHHLVSGPASYLVGVAPALPIIGIFVAIGLCIVEETDEYLKMLLVRQSLVASAFMLTIVTAWGFLETVDLVPHVDAYFAAVLWFAGLGVGSIANRFSA